ncbi:glycosyltransferase [Hymenobacter sp. 5516J-16]|uniref:glycosyltransferase n=1 Tax=Hymenobacter sp. 5516J-16 TaxID=2932253 RepID=UPI001FD60E50|nr:glycosyltransferase [Hymenobacter sp. 5516J-16]UOQ78037.1 glycosyltransferase [Hymenobacter sp. 5516J-16]
MANLTQAEARAPHPHPDERPGAWQRPAAPYLGASETAGAATPFLAASDGSWQAPAAPYLGATPPAVAAEAAATAPVATTIAVLPDLEPSPRPQDSAVFAATPTPPPASEAPELSEQELQLNQDEFAGAAAEPDGAEAAALSQPADDLVPEPTPAPATEVLPQLASLPEALAALGTDSAAPADFNFQVIQYARFATRRALLENFSVIYASDWPTWLAALEIRQQTGRPLVLHVHSLAQERATPADRGWALELERLTLRRADVVLAASEEVAALLRTRYPALGSRLRVLDPTDIETLTTTLRQLENGLPGRQLAAPFFPPTA